jgi:hypothetical protein
VPADVDKATNDGEPPPPDLPDDERRAWEHLLTTYKQIAYAQLMWTRPQTLYGIADSPVGLVAWLLDHGDGGGQPAEGTTTSKRAATSPPGSSPSSSAKRSARPSDRCADRCARATRLYVPLVAAIRRPNAG